MGEIWKTFGEIMHGNERTQTSTVSNVKWDGGTFLHFGGRRVEVKGHRELKRP